MFLHTDNHCVLTTGIPGQWGYLNSSKNDVETHQDGVGRDTVLLKPEYLYQHKAGNRTLFVDRQSCLRQINHNNDEVTTILGKHCQFPVDTG